MKASLSTNVPDIALAIGIAIVFVVLVIYTPAALLPYPEAPAYYYANEADCLAANGNWDSEYAYCSGSDFYSDEEMAAYDSAVEATSFFYFVSITLVSIAAVILGLFVVKKPSVASGLLFGGLLALLIASFIVIYIGAMGMISMALVLAVLIIAAYKKKGKK